jgi:hypothetical protein
MFGVPTHIVYGAAKSAVYGLTNGMALEGAPYGIKVNSVSPNAMTFKHALMRDPVAAEVLETKLSEVDRVAALVAYLSHHTCESSGGLFYANKGVVREYRMYQSAGIDDSGLTPEGVALSFDRIRDQAGSIERPAMFDPARIGEAIDAMYQHPYVPS